MNARFAAVALSSCLSATLASQLFPLPSLVSLVDASKPSGRPIADSNPSPSNEARPAQPLQMQLSRTQAPRTNDGPQAVNAREIADVLVASAAAVDALGAAQALPADAPQTIDAPRAAETSPAADAPQLAAADSNDVPQAPATSFVAADNSAFSATPAAVAAPITSAPTDTAEALDKPQASDRPQASFQIASADPTEMLPSETAPSGSEPNQVAPSDAQDGTADSITTRPVFFEAYDECVAVEICIDRYLWALYQRTPKEDKMKVSEQRAVTVKRKHKMVTVMRTFTRLVDENFAWKDEAASTKLGLPMVDYVIGGMDRGFKQKLFHVLYAADEAGLSPGITSAFRDDYRQAIATGLKAANDRSYHGGSFHGGYGHGLAADIVSVKGATRAERWAATEVLWKWIDAHGKDFGIGRPYLSYDPPHVGPTDGAEWARHRGSDTIRLARAEMKTAKHLVARHEHGSAKHAKSAASAKMDRIRSARNRPSRTA